MEIGVVFMEKPSRTTGLRKTSACIAMEQVIEQTAINKLREALKA